MGIFKENFKVWFKNPMNLALFVWITYVAVSGAIFFLVMIGMFNSALPKKLQRNAWFEVNNQILNALLHLCACINILKDSTTQCCY